MQSNDIIRIKFPVRFLKNKTVLYLNSQSGKSEVYIKEYFNDLFQRFDEACYTFAYLPNLISQLSPDILQFIFPGQTDIISTENTPL